MPDGKNFYITTSIAYTNSNPHLGFALELVQADCVARYKRQKGENVFFLTGTDEHGIKISKTAEKEGLEPQKFVDKISLRFKELTNLLNLSNDDFIRTTDEKRHLPVVKKIWLNLQKNGDIYKKRYKGMYCFGCEAFITKKDLENGKCVIHKKEPEIIEEENYFFRLSKYLDKVRKVIVSDEIKIKPSYRKKEILNSIDQGLEDISFSRPATTLKWGIEVPGDSSQTIYVWVDALSNYISAVGYGSLDFSKYWPADIHFIGKDIQKFHCILWPAILMSLNLELPKSVFIHGFITVNGQKMSKSLGNVIDPFDLILNYGGDAVRYFLLREIPPNEDGDFTLEKFQKRYNSDLASGLGNLVSRVVSLKRKLGINNDEIVLSYEKDLLMKKIDEFSKKYDDFMKEMVFNEALAVVWDLISFCDLYIEKKKPWEKSEYQVKIIENLIFFLKKISNMIYPFMPLSSEKILSQIKENEDKKIFPRK
jgi:methionyl-tRNA synthetase